MEEEEYGSVRSAMQQVDKKEKSKTEAELVVKARTVMSAKLSDVISKIIKIRDDAKEDIKIEGTDKKKQANQYADVAENMYKMHKELNNEYDSLKQTLTETSESLNRISVNSVLGRQAANLMSKWEAELENIEKKLQEAIDNITETHATAVEETKQLGFRVGRPELPKLESTAESEFQLAEVTRKLDRQGLDIKKKLGSTMISNKQVIIGDFDGEPENWDEFYEIFRPVVEENTELLDVVKFAILKRSCKGKAEDMIKVFNSADCFQQAIERLKKNYEDKDNKFRMLWDKLTELKVSKETVSSMRKTINDVASILSALKRISDVETPALRVLVKRKFPRKILEELSRNKESETTESILKVIEDTVRREEHIEKDMYLTNVEQRTFYTQRGEDRIEKREYKTRDYSQDRNRKEYSNGNYRGRYRNERSYSRGRDQSRGYSSDRNRGERNRRSYSRERNSRGYDTRTRGYQSSSKYSDRSNSRGRDYRKSPFPERRECIFCRNNHLSADCRKISRIEDRTKFFKDKQLCFNCGRNNHPVRECNRRHCYKCEKKHHSALCPRKVRFNDRRSEERSRYSSGDRSRQSSGDRSRNSSRSRHSSGERSRRSSEDRSRNSSRDRYRGNNRSYNGRSYNRVNMTKTGETNLMIAPVEVRGPKSRNRELPIVETLAILDSGAEQNYVEEDLAEYIGAEVVERDKKLTILTVGGKETKVRSDKVKLELLTPEGRIKVEALTIPKITTEFDPIQIDRSEKAFMRENEIKYRKPRGTQAGILLGIDSFMKVMKNMEAVTLPTGRAIISTRLGNIVCGSMKDRNSREFEKMFVTREDKEEELELTLEDHFKLQNIGIVENPIDPKVEEIKEMFHKTVTVDEEKRVCVTFPFKKGMIIRLADNYKMALARLRSMYNQSRNTEAWNKLIRNFDDMIERKIIEDTEINADEDENRPVYYIPYQLVYNENSSTTKVRTVFDASSSVKGEISLNQAVHQGPSLIPELLGILLRIRTHYYILVGDIEKAFHMVGLQDIHRDCTRFLYLKNPLGKIEDENLRHMRFTRIPFGVNASPYLLAMAIEYAINKSEASEKLKEVINRMCYVDNLFGTSNDDKELIKLYQESKEVFSNTGMNIREFSLNSPLENSIDEKDRIKERQNTKLLGYLFDGKTDKMTVKKSTVKLTSNKPVTKREVVQVVSSTYDPLQIFAPVYLDGKKLIREISGKNLKWNGEVQKEIVEKVKEYIKKIEACDFSFTRFLGIPDKEECTLAVFSDASKDVYGACAYLTWPENREIKAELVMAKQRLAPKGHTVTIPRLELIGIVLAVRVAKYLIEELDIQVNVIGIYSDSTIALNQIKSFKKDSVFIENRRNEIRTTLEELKYNEKEKTFREVYLAHVVTDDNTADLITRGIESDKELRKTNWFDGAKCIRKPNAKIDKILINLSEDESRNIVLIGRNKRIKVEIEDISIIPDHHRKDLDRACRMIAYVLRFIIKVAKKAKINFEKGIAEQDVEDITPANELEIVRTTEINCAERMLIKEHQKAFNISTQQELNQQENKKTGVVEQLFRAENMTPKPIINPKSVLGGSIIDKVHRENYHCGVNTTLGIIRAQYAGRKWRLAIKNRLKLCVRCRKANNRPFPTAPTGNLPERRIEDA